MRNPKTYSMPFSRKRKGKTDYRKRLKLLSSGEARFVVRKSLKNVSIAIVRHEPKGDRVELTFNATSLEKLGWQVGKGNLPSAYLTGYLAGKKALQKGVKKAILDAGLQPSIKGSRIYAAVAGAIDTGFEIPVNKEVLPPKERLNGTHIAGYAEMLEKRDKVKYTSQFSDYIKKNINPKNIPELFELIKGKIEKL